MSQIVGQCPILFVVGIKTQHELIPLFALIPSSSSLFLWELSMKILENI